MVEEINDGGFIKVLTPLDTMDRVDTEGKKGTKEHSSSLAEKLEQIKNWIIQNKDSNGLIDSMLLAVKIREIGLDVQQTIQLLKDEYWLRDVPVLGKFGVK